MKLKQLWHICELFYAITKEARAAHSLGQYTDCIDVFYAVSNAVHQQKHEYLSNDTVVKKLINTGKCGLSIGKYWIVKWLWFESTSLARIRCFLKILKFADVSCETIYMVIWVIIALLNPCRHVNTQSPPSPHLSVCSQGAFLGTSLHYRLFKSWGPRGIGGSEYNQS